MSFNPYKVLAVDPSADVEVVTAAYRALSKKYHPDINRTPQAEQIMRDINRAYELLKDPVSRRKVDAELTRDNPRPANNQYSRSNPNSAGSGGFQPDLSGLANNVGQVADNVADNLRRGFGNIVNNVREFRPEPANQPILYFYQKKLTDELTRKSLQVSVYDSGATNQKLCSIKLSSPNGKGALSSSEVILDSGTMFDLTLAISDASRIVNEPSQPLQMLKDHDLYFTRKIVALKRNYIGVEVIKLNQGSSAKKELHLLIGQNDARRETNGVIAEQNQSQIEQISRVMESALESMR